MNPFRLIVDPPLSGPVNMARDEALLSSCHVNDTQPVLRFYAWRPATISLGYFQDYTEYERLESPAGELPVVRRTTGGGAILHDLEVTYSIVMPLSHPLITGRPNELYHLAHRAIIEAVGGPLRLYGSGSEGCDESSRRGPFFCFARRHDLDIVRDDSRGPGGASKLAGSAQRRTATAVLQHGSIILDSRYPQQPVATWRALDSSVDYEAAVRRLIPAFENAIGTALSVSEWRRDELEAARRFEERYTGDDWTIRRQR